MIKHIEITDFCGIKQLKLDVSKFNIFTGNPTQGKTSILNAIRWCVIGDNNDFLIRNGANSTEVVLHSDNGSRIERRMTRGSSSKVTIYTKDNKVAPKPQEILNKLYNPFLFRSTDILKMKAKELNEFISNALSSKLKITDELVKLYLLDDIELSNNPIVAIKEKYDELYERRAKVNKIVKETSIKSSNVDLSITEEDVNNLQSEFDELKIKLDKLKANKAQREIIQQNIKIQESTEHNISEIKKCIDSYGEIDTSRNLDGINKEISDKEKELKSLEKEVSDLKSKYESLRTLLKKLDSDKIVCPYSNNIKCETDFSEYRTTLNEEINNVTKTGKEKADTLQNVSADIVTLKHILDKNNILKSKKLELDRYQSILDQINIITVDEDTDDIEKVQELYKSKESNLTRAKVSLETKNITNIEDVQNEQKRINLRMDRIKEFLEVEVPKMLKIGIADLKVDNTGIYYKDVPLSQLGDCMMMRICTSIIKSIYPDSTMFTMDGFEHMGVDGMTKYINYFASEDNQIQYFGTYVGEIKSGLKNCKVFNVVNFEVS